MKYIKMLGLLAVAAAALMAFAGTASATTLTSPAGTSYTSTIKAQSSHTVLHGPTDITCAHSTVEGKVESHGKDVTASGKISSLKFEQCNAHVTVLNAGELIVHTHEKDPKGTSSNGTLTSTGAEITVQVTTPIQISCIYKTSETDIGTLTGSSTTKGHAVLDIDSVAIPREGHSIFCGSSGEWTGSYTVTSPNPLDVD